jgi:hypothetical protein
MSDSDLTGAGGDWAGGGSLNIELCPSDRSSEDIDDRVDGTDFVEMDLIDADAMYFGFGFGESLEDP